MISRPKVEPDDTRPVTDDTVSVILGGGILTVGSFGIGELSDLVAIAGIVTEAGITMVTGLAIAAWASLDRGFATPGRPNGSASATPRTRFAATTRCSDELGGDDRRSRFLKLAVKRFLLPGAFSPAPVDALESDPTMAPFTISFRKVTGNWLRSSPDGVDGMLLETREIADRVISTCQIKCPKYDEEYGRGDGKKTRLTPHLGPTIRYIAILDGG